MRTTASIVNYNDLENTQNAVRSILAHTKETDFRLFVVDNSADPKSADNLTAMFPQIEVIRSGRNDGFGAAHNLVIGRIDSAYHAIINPDITVESDVIGKMAAFFDENPDVGIACPATFFPDGRPQLLPKRDPSLKYLAASRLPFGWAKRTRAHYIMADEDLTRVKDVEFVTGCFMFARTGLLKKVGGFDERYFLYMEDADLTREIRRYARAVYVPSIKVIHDWNRKSARSIKYFTIHIASVLKYLKKWKKDPKRRKGGSNR
jgi:GT2 family glycosyltransferase